MKKELEIYYKNIQNYDWTEIADGLKGPEAFLHRLREERIKELFIRFYKGGNCLDAGCGTGLVTRNLPVDSVGLDINPRNIEKLKRHAPHIRGVIANLESIPFPNNSFSTIICTEVVEHFTDPKPALKELLRVLKPGGIIIWSIPTNSILWKLRFLSFTCRGDQREPYHKHYSKKEFKKILKDFFEIIESNYYSFFFNLYVITRKNV